MRNVMYSLETACSNTWRDKWMNLLSAFLICSGLAIFGSFLILSFNMESAVRKWFNDFSIVIYLNKGISSDEEEALKNFFIQDSDVLSLRYISKEEALLELKDMLGAGSRVLESVEENPLPSSFEIKMKREILIPALLRQKTALFSKVPGVNEIQFGEEWLESLIRTSMILKSLLLITGTALASTVIFISYGTIRILFYRRMDEIETLKLLGATRRFIRMPFLMEGMIIGTAGGALCSLSLFASYRLVSLRLMELMPSLKAFLVTMPEGIFFYGPAAGAVLSFIGSYFAVGKIKY
ncbi:MAG: ABC transporter permease [Nitrospirae bacterium]|nr:ABC transporter permease [Nitrospirota bacterium]